MKGMTVPTVVGGSNTCLTVGIVVDLATRFGEGIALVDRHLPITWSVAV